MRITPTQILKNLLLGNKRFVENRSIHPHQSPHRRKEIIVHQEPSAVIIDCSDSRVAPEIIFDQGLGDLFVVRTAGVVLDDAGMASVEYAVMKLKVGLVMVLGHENCGAMHAAAHSGQYPGHIPFLVKILKPAVDEAKKLPGDLVNNAVKIDVTMVVEKLKTNSLVKRQIQKKQLMVVGAYYHLESGEVEILK